MATMTAKLPMLPHSSVMCGNVFISRWEGEWSDWGAEDGDCASFTNTHSLSHDLHDFFFFVSIEMMEVESYPALMSNEPCAKKAD